MNADQILKALKSGKLSERALLIIADMLSKEITACPPLHAFLIDEINRINKPLREQVDDAIKELDV